MSRRAVSESIYLRVMRACKNRRMMTNVDESEYGPRLYAYLEQHWRALGTNANQWTGQHPELQGPTVSRWRTGSVPKVAAMRAVADALGVSLVDVLVAAGVLDKREVGRDAATPPAPTIDAAIANDPSLHPRLRQTLRDLVDAWRSVDGGQSERVRRTSRPTRR